MKRIDKTGKRAKPVTECGVRVRVFQGTEDTVDRLVKALKSIFGRRWKVTR